MPIDTQYLPEDYWRTVELWLPKYQSRQDVADNDDLTKYVEREMFGVTEEEHNERIKEMDEDWGSPEAAEESLDEENVEFYLEAVQYKLKAMQDALEALLESPDLNLDDLDNATIKAIAQAREALR